MKKRNERQGTSRLVDIQEFCKYISMGEGKARTFARENGLEIRIGKACRYDLRKTDTLLDQLASD